MDLEVISMASQAIGKTLLQLDTFPLMFSLSFTFPSLDNGASFLERFWTAIAKVDLKDWYIFSKNGRESYNYFMKKYPALCVDVLKY